MVIDLNGRSELNLASAVGVLKAVAEPTRLRVLVLLAQGELNVKDLTRVLGQSQPRISRHLKLLAEAGLVERAPEGSWVYFRLAEEGRGGEVARQILQGVDQTDPVLVRDRRRERRCKPSGRKRRKPTSNPMRPTGTRSARSTWRKPTWRRPYRRRWELARSTCWSISAPARAGCWNCSRPASAAASGWT